MSSELAKLKREAMARHVTGMVKHAPKEGVSPEMIRPDGRWSVSAGPWSLDVDNHELRVPYLSDFATVNRRYLLLAKAKVAFSLDEQAAIQADYPHIKAHHLNEAVRCTAAYLWIGPMGGYLYPTVKHDKAIEAEAKQAIMTPNPMTALAASLIGCGPFFLDTLRTLHIWEKVWDETREMTAKAVATAMRGEGKATTKDSAMCWPPMGFEDAITMLEELARPKGVVVRRSSAGITAPVFIRDYFHWIFETYAYLGETVGRGTFRLSRPEFYQAWEFCERMARNYEEFYAHAVPDGLSTYDVLKEHRPNPSVFKVDKTKVINHEANRVMVGASKMLGKKVEGPSNIMHAMASSPVVADIMNLNHTGYIMRCRGLNDVEKMVREWLAKSKGINKHGYPDAMPSTKEGMKRTKVCGYKIDPASDYWKPFFYTPVYEEHETVPHSDQTKALRRITLGLANYMALMEQSEQKATKNFLEGLLESSACDESAQIGEAMEQDEAERQERRLPEEFTSIGEEETGGVWGEMHIHRPPLTQPFQSYAAGHEQRSTDTGCVPVQTHRWPIDMRVFKRKMTAETGTILLDASGSMNLPPELMEKLAQILPRCTFAMYSGNWDAKGRLTILIEKGRAVAKPPRKWKEVHGYPGLNVVDGPALRWLAKQPTPRVWISDGYVTGVSRSGRSGEQIFDNLVKDAFHVCRVHNIKRCAHLGIAIAHINKYLRKR